MLFHHDGWMQALTAPVVYAGLPCLYLIAVFVGAMMMKGQQAVKLTRVMQVYNVVQIVVCLYMSVGLAPVLGIPNLFGINSEFTEAGEWFVFVHYLSKYLDWFDTLFIILRKKRSQLSFLHIYHHSTIAAIWGMLCYTGTGNGTVRYGAWINSLTHVFMYSHYLWTSFGFRNPLKKWLTTWQITQFWSCIAHSVMVLALETTTISRFAPLQFVYQSTLVYLFSCQMSWVPGYVPEFGDETTETGKTKEKKVA